MEPKLLEAARLVSSGQADPRQYRDAHKRTREEFQEARAEFYATLESLDSELRPALRGEAAAVERSLDDFWDWLEACRDRVVPESLEHWQTAQVRLNADLLRFRDAVFSQRGPTTHPGLNALFALRHQAQMGDLEPVQWEEAIQQEQARSHAMEDVHAQLQAELAEFEAHYRDFLRLSPAHPQWDEELQRLRSLYARLDLAYLSRNYSGGRTLFPWLNLVMACAQLWAQEAVSEAAFQTVLDRAAGQLQSIADYCRQDTEGSPGPALMGRLGSLVQRYFEVQPADVEALDTEVLAVANELSAYLRSLTTSGKTCSVCGAGATGAVRCPFCGAPANQG